MRNVAMDASNGSKPQEQMLPVDNATVPYWRTELHELDEHRTTEELPAECDIAIIGAGMTGVSTAYHISKLAGDNTPSVVILEARQLCSGATGRNGGHSKVQATTMQSLVRDFGEEAATEVLNSLHAHVYALKKVVEEEGLDCEFEMRRSYDVFCNDDEAEAARQYVRACQQAGQQWTDDVDFVEEKFAEQITSVKGARAATNVPACSFWPYKLVSQLAAKLVERNAVNLQTNTPVTRIDRDNSGNSLLRTTRGTLKAKKVVFATNAWTSGICPALTRKIVPYRGTACHIKPMSSPVFPRLATTYNIKYAPGGRVDYLNPRPNGGIVLGGGKWTFVQDRDLWYNNWDDSKLIPDVRPHFDGYMQRYFRGWENSSAAVDHLWTGIMAYTADELPLVGELPGSKGQYVVAGFNGGGMDRIFLSARGIAEMAVDGVSFGRTGVPALYEATPQRLSKDDGH